MQMCAAFLIPRAPESSDPPVLCQLDDASITFVCDDDLRTPTRQRVPHREMHWLRACSQRPSDARQVLLASQGHCRHTCHPRRCLERLPFFPGRSLPLAFGRGLVLGKAAMQRGATPTPLRQRKPSKCQHCCRQHSAGPPWLGTRASPWARHPPPSKLPLVHVPWWRGACRHHWLQCCAPPWAPPRPTAGCVSRVFVALA